MAEESALTEPHFLLPSVAHRSYARFTFALGAHEEQPVIERGSYRVVRHPRYHDGQLARYFNTTPSVRVAILTNGVRFKGSPTPSRAQPPGARPPTPDRADAAEQSQRRQWFAVNDLEGS